MKKYFRKALKNYTTTQPVTTTISNIQKILIEFGAKGVGFEYNDSGEISGIFFKMIVGENERVINVPLRVERVIELLKRQEQFKDEEHAYRVALRNVQDWLDAQLALLSTEMVELPEIFLPYMVNSTGKTLYEVIKKTNFLLKEPNYK